MKPKGHGKVGVGGRCAERERSVLVPEEVAGDSKVFSAEEVLRLRRLNSSVVSAKEKTLSICNGDFKSPSPYGTVCLISLVVFF